MVLSVVDTSESKRGEGLAVLKMAFVKATNDRTYLHNAHTACRRDGGVHVLGVFRWHLMLRGGGVCVLHEGLEDLKSYSFLHAIRRELGIR